MVNIRLSLSKVWWGHWTYYSNQNISAQIKQLFLLRITFIHIWLSVATFWCKPNDTFGNFWPLIAPWSHVFTGVFPLCSCLVPDFLPDFTLFHQSIPSGSNLPKNMLQQCQLRRILQVNMEANNAGFKFVQKWPCKWKQCLSDLKNTVTISAHESQNNSIRIMLFCWLMPLTFLYWLCRSFKLEAFSVTTQSYLLREKRLLSKMKMYCVGT